MVNSDSDAVLAINQQVLVKKCSYINLVLTYCKAGGRLILGCKYKKYNMYASMEVFWEADT